MLTSNEGVDFLQYYFFLLYCVNYVQRFLQKQIVILYVLCMQPRFILFVLAASIDNVHFQQSTQLIEALVNQNVQFRLQVRPLVRSQYHTLVCYNVITGYR